MKFNIAYMGPEALFNLRRDFILLLKYSLESLGHDVVMSGPNLDMQRFNLVLGAYFLPSEKIRSIETYGLRFAHVNTEVVANDMLNHNPDKVDFMGAYLPSMKAGEFVWDVIMDNMPEYDRYGCNAHFLRWGTQTELQDINHRADKDLDFYFFGMLSGRRRRLLEGLLRGGLKGMADHTCPYFVRNDRIARSKVQLNLIQEDKYTHVNSFRICYLADNASCILSEREHDPAGYLQYAEVVDPSELVEVVKEFTGSNKWKVRADKAREDFSEHNMRDLMESLLDKSFSQNGG